MHKNLFIKKIVAAAMLVVFAFSITPTIVFHNWLADHTDTVNKTSHDTGDHVGKITFNCHCDNIVAESPFTEPDTFTGSPTVKVFPVVPTAGIVQLPASPTIFYSLRGPPVV